MSGFHARGVSRAIVLCLIFLEIAAGQLRRKPPFAEGQYILILSDPPVAERFATRDQLRSLAAGGYRQQVQARQQVLTRALASKNVKVTGSVTTLLNAIFVAAPANRFDELKTLPGVLAVRPVRRGERHANRAVQLLNGPAAWSIPAIGGQLNAGKGMKIAILDSGIDHNHPAFQDSSLTMPPGFPKCNAVSDCQNFTNNKVIVARSYVPWIANLDPQNPDPTYSTPDDYSARDREGHGTAVASVAAGNTHTGSITVNGIAPKAWLGNYKIYGSPFVNDYPPETVWIMAINQAVEDGMDVAVFSSGLPTITGPLDKGAACGLTGDAPCDPLAVAFENAAKTMVIVASAGNDGQSGWVEPYPNFGSISSPAYAPSVVATGATTSSHVMLPTVSIANPGAPANLRNIPAVLGDSNSSLVWGSVATAETAPIVDVAQLDNDGLGCGTLPAYSLLNAYVLVQRGLCGFSAKVQNAEAAGALGVIIYMADSAAPVSPAGVASFFGNVLTISNSDGLALKAYINANRGSMITADLAGAEKDVGAYSQSLSLNPPLSANQFASYSSLGPATGSYAIKPDVVATGGLDVDLFVRPEWPNDAPVAPGMYLATQKFDPMGAMFSPNGYVAGDGTSFAAPLAGGTAALVKQAHPTFTAAEVRSAVINTAAQDVTTDDFGAQVDAQWIGAGRVDAAAAVAATVTVVPSTLSFGRLKSGQPMPQPITVTVKNHGAAAVTLAASVVVARQVSGISVTLDKQSVTLVPGASTTLTATLSGTVPPANSYTGAVTLQGQGVSLRIPYMFLVGTGSAYNIPVILGLGEGYAGESIGYWGVAITDAIGTAVEGSAVTFGITPRGSVTFNSVPGSPECAPATSTTTISCPTDAYGFAWVEIVLGPNPGSPSVTITAAGTRVGPLSIYSRTPPTIADGGVLAAADVDKGAPIVPGSYVAIYGTGLSDYTYANPYTTLPMALAYVSVSFDVPSARISVPGRLVYVSPNQVNVQAPWELQGQTSAKMKIILYEYEFGNVVTVPVADYGPAFFHAAADALDESYRVISASNPAKRGGVVQLYLNGLGPVNNQPGSGEPASAINLATTKTTPVVTIGGVPAQVIFSGLAPGFPGLYQVNVIVPQGVTAGNAVPMTLTIGGQTSKQATLPVQ